MKTIDKAKGIIAALLSSGTFGMIPLFSIPLMAAGMNETTILLYRYIISAIAILTLCLITRQGFRVEGKTLAKLFVMSALYAGTAIGLLYAYNYVASGIVTTIHFMYPVVVVILVTIFYKERMSIRLILTSVLAIIGVGFLSSAEGGNVSIFGLLLSASTAITYALYVVGLRDKDVSKVDGKVITFYMLVFGALIFFLVNRAIGAELSVVPDMTAWTNLLLLALFPTIISILTLVTAVKYIGATVTSILGAAEPLVAMLVGVTIFSEQFTFFSLVGLVLIIAAVTYVIVITNKEEPAYIKVKTKEQELKERKLHGRDNN